MKSSKLKSLNFLNTQNDSLEIQIITKGFLKKKKKKRTDPYREKG